MSGSAHLKKFNNLAQSFSKPSKVFLALLALATIYGCLETAFSLGNWRDLNNSLLSLPPIAWAVLLWSLLTYLSPVLGALILGLVSFFYIIERELLADLLIPSVYLLLFLDGARSFANVIKAKRNLDPEMLSYYSVVILVSVLPLCGLTLLAVGSLDFFSLYITAIGWALAGRYFLSKQSPETVPENAAKRTFSFENSLTQYLYVLVAGCLAFSGFMHMFPDPVAGDSEKAYLAFSRFYAGANTLVLTDPGWVDNVMAAYHHWQEMFLATGWALAKNNGLKFFAFAIVLIKLWSLRFAAVKILKCSETMAAAAVLIFALVPSSLDISAVVRPENLLTVYLILAFVGLETVRKQPEKVIEYGCCVIALFALSVSVKLTGLYAITAALFVYPKECLKICDNLRKSRGLQIVLLVSILLAGVWFLRNWLRWGYLVNMTPFGRYHLTVWFPPVRSVSDWWMMFTKSLIQVGDFTEFSHFGYGLLGFIFYPILFWSLTYKGAVRRIAIFSLLYIFCLHTSTRQIRYLLPIVPLVTLISVIVLRDFYSKLTGGALSYSRLQMPVLLATTLSLLTALIVIKHSYLMSSVRARINSFGTGSLVARGPIQIINEYTTENDRLLLTYLDFNYTPNARMLRGEPYDSIGKLAEYQKKYNFSHWVAFSYGLSRTDNPIFNDLSLLEMLSEPIVKAPSLDDPNWWLYLLKPSLPRLQLLIDFVKSHDLDPHKVLLVSEAYKKSHPLDFITGNGYSLPGFSQKIYFMQAKWDDSQQVFSNYQSPSTESLLGWSFLDVKSEQNLVTKCRTERPVHGADEISLCDIEISKGKNAAASSQLRFYARRPLGAAPRSAFFSLSKNGQSSNFRIESAEDWKLILSERVRPGDLLQLRGPPELFEVGPSAMLQGPRFMLVSQDKNNTRANKTAVAKSNGNFQVLSNASQESITLTLESDGIARDSKGKIQTSSTRGLSFMPSKLVTSSQRYVAGEAEISLHPPLELSHNVAIEIKADGLYLSPGDRIRINLRQTHGTPNSDSALYSKDYSSQLQCPDSCILGALTLPFVPGLAEGGGLTAHLKFDNTGKGPSHVGKFSLSMRASSNSTIPENLDSMLDFSTVPTNLQSIGVIENFQSPLQDLPTYLRGDVDRSLQAVVGKSLMVTGSVVAPQFVNQTGILRYRFELPEHLRKAPLTALLRTVGRTYQEGDYIAVSVRRGNEVTKGKKKTGDSAFNQWKLRIPPQEDVSELSVDVELTATEFSDRTFLQGLLLFVGKAEGKSN